MSLPPAPRGGPAVVLPHRAEAARYLLWGAIPFATLTFALSAVAADGMTVRVALIAAAAVSPFVLVYVGHRVGYDNGPARAGRAELSRRAGQWNWTDVVAFVPATAAAVLFTGSLLVGLTQGLDQGLRPAARNAVESFAGQAATYLAAVGALASLLVLRRGLRLPNVGWRRPRRAGWLGWPLWLVMGVVGAGVSLLVAGWLGSLATQLLPNSPNTQCTAVRGEYGGYVAVAIPLVCLIAPLAEETMFRGFLYGWLRRHLPVIPAVIASAAVFSAAHTVLVLALPLFGVGVVLALVYEYTDSLVPGAIVHGLFNLYGILAILGAAGC